MDLTGPSWIYRVVFAHQEMTIYLVAKFTGEAEEVGRHVSGTLMILWNGGRAQVKRAAKILGATVGPITTSTLVVALHQLKRIKNRLPCHSLE